MTNLQLNVIQNLTEIVKYTILSPELCKSLKRNKLVTKLDYEELRKNMIFGRQSKGAEYLFTTIAPKLAAADEHLFIQALRDGKNERVIDILCQVDLQYTPIPKQSGRITDVLLPVDLTPTSILEESWTATDVPHNTLEPHPTLPLLVSSTEDSSANESLVQATQKIWYYPKKQLGIGGFSTVFEGYFEHPTRRVAVKVIKKDDVEESKEIEILRKVEHDFIVRYYINEIKGHLCYIVMDLAESTLDKWVAEEPAQESEELAKVCKQITLGLNHLHQNKIIHRDIKPTNVLIIIDQAGVRKAKLTDFGISRMMEKRPDGVSTQIGTKGTLTFFPPEAHESPTHGKFILKPSFDIFPLGIVLAFTMTRGKHIFKWKENDRPIKIQANVSDVNVNWGILSSCDFRCLKNLLQVMLKENPDERNLLTILLQHPFFWDYKKQFQFILAVSNDIKNKTIDEAKLEDAWKAYKSAVLDVEDDWKLRLDLVVQEWIEEKDKALDLKTKKTPFGWRKYDGTKLVQLLNFIRDQHQHYKSREDYPDLSNEDCWLFGNTISKYEEYFVRKFPELCVIVYNVLHGPAKKGSHSLDYFKGMAQTVFTLNWN